MVLGMAYTCSKEEAQEWKQEIAEKFPEYEIVEGPLSLSVACHIGPGAMAVTCMKKSVIAAGIMKNVRITSFYRLFGHFLNQI